MNQVKKKKMRAFLGGEEASWETKEAWFAAVEAGNDQQVAELLVENPSLVHHTNFNDCTALHIAAACGYGQIVARILAASPDAVNAKCHKLTQNETALHLAAKAGHEGVVAQLLAASPRLIHVASEHGITALHEAAMGGHDEVVALLLAAKPDMATARTNRGLTALVYAAKNGHEKVFAQLLAVCPQLIDLSMTDKSWSVLHYAASAGHDKVVERIVALRPEMIHAHEKNNLTALDYAVIKGHSDVADRLLSLQPEQAFIATDGYSLLSMSIRRCGDAFIERVWRINPQALHLVDSNNNTPFSLAVRFKKHSLIELFQGSMTFDEIVSAFTHSRISFEERYRPVMEKQCALLWEQLNRDVASVVFAYLF